MRIEPKNIMCAIDFSDFSHLILSYGTALASEFGARLCLCHIVSDMVIMSSHGQAFIASEKVTRERRENAGKRLENLAAEYGIEAEMIVTSGHPADRITQLVQEKSIDLVIAATHGGSGIKRFLLGSVTDRLVKTLACPFLVLHAKHGHTSFQKDFTIPLQRILVGCDFSSESDLAFKYALSLAQEFQAELHLVYVKKPKKQIELFNSEYLQVHGGDHLALNHSDLLQFNQKTEEQEGNIRNRVEQQLDSMVPEESRNWCTPVIRLLDGDAYKELINYAEEKKIDMIVLGVHGHSLVEQFLVGSTTDRVISRACRPVLAVRKLS